MSAKAIREATGKDLLNRHLKCSSAVKSRFASVDENTNFTDLLNQNPWLGQEVIVNKKKHLFIIIIIRLFYLKNLNFQKLVVKCDQLIKRRGKLGLIQVNADYDKVKQWISERINRDQKIQKAVGKLRNFIIEPFVPHADVSKKG